MNMEGSDGPGSLGVHLAEAGCPNKRGTAFISFGSHQHIFYRDAKNTIQHVFYDPQHDPTLGDPWTTAKATDKTGPPALGDPATMAWYDPNSGDLTQKHVFYRDVGDGIWNLIDGFSAEAWGPEKDAQTAASRASETAFGEFCNYYRPPIPMCTLSNSAACVQPNSLGFKTWKYHTDGVAHYGMLPDFLTEVKTIPGGPDLVDNAMMYGAEYLYQTWRFAEQQKGNVPKKLARDLHHPGAGYHFRCSWGKSRR